MHEIFEVLWCLMVLAICGCFVQAGIIVYVLVSAHIKRKEKRYHGDEG